MGDAAVAYHVPILSNNRGNFEANDPGLIKTGFPSTLGSGSRTLYTAKEGLRRVGRLGGLDLDADGGNLPLSGEAGRVSFIMGAAPQNLETRLAELSAERDRLTAEIKARYEKAVAIVRGQN